MQSSIDRFWNTLRVEGLEGGLRLLNRGVEHRYTAIYQLEGVEFRNTVMIDKAGQEIPAYMAFIPVHDSFCQFVMRDGPFQTENSELDTRLDGLPYKGVVLAYHGVPLRNERGDLVGALSHLDTVQRKLSGEQFDFLQQAAEILPAFIPPH